VEGVAFGCRREAADKGHHLTPRRPTADTSKLFALIAGVVVVAALYFARAVLVPFALAVLLSFLLTPLVRQVERLRLPRVPAVLVVVILVVALAIWWQRMSRTSCWT